MMSDIDEVTLIFGLDKQVEGRFGHLMGTGDRSWAKAWIAIWQPVPALPRHDGIGSFMDRVSA